MFVVLPSEWYENNPRAIIEGFALGKPAVGSRIGGIPELVRDDETGFTFQAGDPEDLKKKILLLVKNPEKILLMGKRARSFVEQELNPEQHYEKLMEIYKQAM
jgi:glycosyltransferase involved in cell wall biosynthesis